MNGVITLILGLWLCSNNAMKERQGPKTAVGGGEHISHYIEDIPVYQNNGHIFAIFYAQNYFSCTTLRAPLFQYGSLLLFHLKQREKRGAIYIKTYTKYIQHEVALGLKTEGRPYLSTVFRLLITKSLIYVNSKLELSNSNLVTRNSNLAARNSNLKSS